jgi:hypothetical protein
MIYFSPDNAFDCFVVEGFSGRLLQSLHPRFRAAFNEQTARSASRKPLQFPAGTYNSFTPQFKGQPSIHFNYKIETVWKDAFPSTIKATIDLTPMKNSIYKIRK